MRPRPTLATTVVLGLLVAPSADLSATQTRINQVYCGGRPCPGTIKLTPGQAVTINLHGSGLGQITGGTTIERGFPNRAVTVTLGRATNRGERREVTLTATGGTRAMQGLDLQFSLGDRRSVTAPVNVSVAARSTSPVLSVTSVTLEKPDPTTCTYRWVATLRNDGGTPSGNDVEVQTYLGDASGNWVPASGLFGAPSGFGAPSVPAGGERSTGWITFVRGSNKPRFVVRLKQSGAQIAEREQAFPVEPPPQVEVGNYAQTGATAEFEVLNKGAAGLADVTVQAYGSNDSAGPWSAAGGSRVPCIEANDSYRGTVPGTNLWPYMKIQVKQENVVIAEEILSGVESTGSGGGRR